ncbi:MAG TPA: type II CAAX endopeptidase family protein [Usitatibacter sp.]|nr:type II CAAX endopeptidase family protein [Usitatibacter sp.]
MRHRAEIPPPLADDALRTTQVAFLLFVIYAVTAMLGVTWGRTADPALRFAYENLLIHAMTAACLIGFALAVPQLRRSLPFLYSSPRVALSPVDVFAFLGVMIAWGLGAHRLLVLLPLLAWYPPSHSVLVDTASAWTSSAFILAWSLTSGMLAPFSEELVFRGILLNLWRRRWGTGRAVIFSAAAFGAVHLQYAIFATVAGAFLALVYLKYRSLRPGTLLHSLYNLVAGPFAIGRFVVQKHADAMFSPGEWLPELALTLAFFPLLLLFWRRFRPAN